MLHCHLLVTTTVNTSNHSTNHQKCRETAVDPVFPEMHTLRTSCKYKHTRQLTLKRAFGLATFMRMKKEKKRLKDDFHLWHSRERALFPEMSHG